MFRRAQFFRNLQLPPTHPEFPVSSLTVSVFCASQYAMMCAADGRPAYLPYSRNDGLRGELGLAISSHFPVMLSYLHAFPPKHSPGARLSTAAGHPHVPGWQCQVGGIRAREQRGLQVQEVSSQKGAGRNRGDDGERDRIVAGRTESVPFGRLRSNK